LIFDCRLLILTASIARGFHKLKVANQKSEIRNLKSVDAD